MAFVIENGVLKQYLPEEEVTTVIIPEDVACDGGVLDFFVDNGLGPIVMEVWKDGKWCRK